MFFSQVDALKKRLCLLEAERKTLAEKVEEDRDREAQLREELQTTSWNYEGQLSLMSEHLAQLNDRLTRQTDEIEELRGEVSSSKVIESPPALTWGCGHVDVNFSVTILRQFSVQFSWGWIKNMNSSAVVWSSP